MRSALKMFRREINPAFAALICAVALIGLLVFMIGSRAVILATGQEILLKTKPVDPRDLMRGDYVRLDYGEISRPDTALFVGEAFKHFYNGPLWVSVKVGKDGFATPIAVNAQKPAPMPGVVVLQTQENVVFSPDTMSVGVLKFGIERYFVPEGEGLEIEKARNKGRTSVAVRVNDDGQAQIARLMIDGQTLYKEPLY